MKKNKDRIKPEELKKYDDDLKIEFGWKLLDCGRYEEGLALYDSLSWKTDGEMKYTGMVRALSGMGHCDEARRLLNRGLRKYPDSYALWIANGALYEDLGDDFRSLKCFEIALRFAPEDNSAGLYNKALALMRIGCYGDAISILEDLINKFPEEPRYLADRGWCALNMGYPLQAIQYYEKAKEVWQSNPNVYAGIYIFSGLCTAYAESGMKGEALGIAMEGLRAFPDGDPVLYQNLGALFYDMGWRREALEVLKKGVEKFPYDEELKESLKRVEEDVDDPDGGENPPLLALIFLVVMIHKKLRDRRF